MALGHPRRARDIMTTDVVTIAPDTPFRAVARALHDNKISGLPVVDEDGRVIGVVSEADLAYKVEYRLADYVLPRVQRHEDHEAMRKAAAVTAVELMSAPPITVDLDTPVGAIARVLDRAQINRVPVVDDDDRLLGIVSRHDLLKSFTRADIEVADEVRQMLRRIFRVDTADTVVREGVVTLTGRLPHKSQIPVAVRLAQSIEGVVDAISELAFDLDDTAAGTGDDLAHPRAEPTQREVRQ
jgi:CBS domain-containing protein